MEKIINARVTHKHDFEANWIKAVNFIPKAGEMIVYNAEDANSPMPESRTEPITYIRLKFGDGVQNVNDLPFTDEALRTELEEQIQDSVADWAQIDETAIDYIKNKTHWIETGIIENYNGTMTFTTQNVTNKFDTNIITYRSNSINLQNYTKPDILPAVVLITIDDITYTCPVEGYNQDISLTKVQIGENDYLSVSIMYIGYNALWVYCTANLINKTFSIKTEGDLYHPLDVNYIPDTIARTSKTQELSSDIAQLKRQVVYHDITQSLTETQKARARANIEALYAPPNLEIYETYADSDDYPIINFNHSENDYNPILAGIADGRQDNHAVNLKQLNTKTSVRIYRWEEDD